MSPTLDASLACIRILDTASNLLERDGVVSTERIAHSAQANVKDVFCVMADLNRHGAVEFHGGMQVWVLVRE